MISFATTYDWGLIWKNHHALLNGLATGAEVAAAALVISLIIGLFLALVRMGPRPWCWVAVAYINVFRGLPALVSGIWVYFGLALALNISLSVFQAGVIALSLLYSAFLAEIFRSALEAVPPGQREAGLALGMNPVRIFISVTLPQAAKIALPNVGSMFIGMLKDTSTFTIIGLVEIVRVVQNVNSVTFQPFVLYTAGRRDVHHRRVHHRLHLPLHRVAAQDAPAGAARPGGDRPQTPAHRRAGGEPRCRPRRLSPEPAPSPSRSSPHPQRRIDDVSEVAAVAGNAPSRASGGHARRRRTGGRRLRLEQQQQFVVGIGGDRNDRRHLHLGRRHVDLGGLQHDGRPRAPRAPASSRSTPVS